MPSGSRNAISGNHPSAIRIAANDVTDRLKSQGDGGLLPAAWKSPPPNRHIELCEDDVVGFLRNDLLTTRITDVRRHLWMVGRKLPPRPLHVQLVMLRDIVVSEQIELHMVWTKGKMFVKPLPRYLCDSDFWNMYLSDEEEDQQLVKCARGLIHSYTALVAYESDLRIAHEKGLLPSDIEWPEWRAFVREFIKSSGPPRDVYRRIDERYHYGELRLSRLNKIYMVRNLLKDGLVYGYSNETAYSRFSDFFDDNLQSIAAVLAYMVIILTALQLGIATDELQKLQSFQNVCYGFTIFAILSPLAGFAFIMVGLVFLFLAGLVRTLLFRGRRNAAMGVTADSQQQDGIKQSKNGTEMSSADSNQESSTKKLMAASRSISSYGGNP